MTQDIYLKRPFKTRNADEFELSEILHLFVNPLDGLTTPFDYENSIIKGRMGSGKTMYLRANYAFYLYGILPALQNNDQIILPVLIRLSDFQHINEPSSIYRSIIIKVIEELSSIYEDLQDIVNLGRIHLGMKSLAGDPRYAQKLKHTLKQLISLGSEEFVERITNETGAKGGIKPQFFELSAEYRQSTMTEIKQKPNPGIKDIEGCYKNLFGDYENTKILLLIDEAGALDKRFFRGEENNSFFEILMNQFRTAQFIRTKIALYPHSYSDVLTETRYGDFIRLEENIYNEEGYKSLRKRTLDIISNYISDTDTKIAAQDLFQVAENKIHGDGIEQLIYASNGNVRRLIQLLDASMSAAYQDNLGNGKVLKEHAINALKSHSNAAEAQYTEVDKNFLNPLIAVCKTRGTFKFQFPSMSPVLSKFTTKSQEFNLISILEIGSGRKGTTYAFDYAFCVHHDIPTHYLRGSEKIDRNRSLDEGEWISRITTISQELIAQANIAGKIEGTIEWVVDDNAFVKGDDLKMYYTNRKHIIDDDLTKQFIIGKRVRFYPVSIEDALMAVTIEIL